MSFLEENHMVYRSNPVGTAVLIDRIFPGRVGCSARIVNRIGMIVVVVINQGHCFFNS
jgi:hypothetical protein